MADFQTPSTNLECGKWQQRGINSWYSNWMFLICQINHNSMIDDGFETIPSNVLSVFFALHTVLTCMKPNPTQTCWFNNAGTTGRLQKEIRKPPLPRVFAFANIVCIFPCKYLTSSVATSSAPMSWVSVVTCKAELSYGYSSTWPEFDFMNTQLLDKNINISCFYKKMALCNMSEAPCPIWV